MTTWVSTEKERKEERKNEKKRERIKNNKNREERENQDEKIEKYRMTGIHQQANPFSPFKSLPFVKDKGFI